MNDENELFPGQPGVFRYHVEGAVARSRDDFDRFMWSGFAWFSGLLNSYVERLPDRGRVTFIELVLSTARHRFSNDKPAVARDREAHPLAWFNDCIQHCINPRK